MNILKKSSKKGQLNGIMGKVILMVILFSAAPVLYLILKNTTDGAGFSSIPLIGGFGTLIGLLFGWQIWKATMGSKGGR